MLLVCLVLMLLSIGAWAADKKQSLHNSHVVLQHDQGTTNTGEGLSSAGFFTLKWKIPAGTLLPAGDCLVIWADEDGGDEGLHANFKLSASGETLWLYDQDNHDHALLDTVTFPAMLANQSLGRLPDGTGPWQITVTPSPGAANQ